MLSAGLAPFLGLAPLFNEHFLQFLADRGNNTGLARLCSDVLGTSVPAGACTAILRFLYNMFHSITLFAPVDDAFAKLPLGLQDFLFDPANVELARYVILVCSFYVAEEPPKFFFFSRSG